MGLRISEVRFLCEAIKLLKLNEPTRPIRICSLGYPDLLASISSVAEATGIDSCHLRPSEHSQAVALRHGLESQIQPCCSNSLFEAWNASLTIFDIVKDRGDEELIDLNERDVTIPFQGCFDIVIDNGTLEHCFNIGEAFKNVAGLVKPVNGFILHINPFTMANHGFYNLNPTFYYDAYTKNSFDIVGALITALDESSAMPFDWTQRFVLDSLVDKTGKGCVMTVLARSQGVTHEFIFPCQSKYA